MQNSTFLEKTNQRIANSITVKLISIGVLMLLLMIPMSMIKSLITERQYTHENAIQEVSEKWGNEQVITGLVLSVPYKTRYKSKNKDGEVKIYERKEHAYFLPDQLKITGEILPEIRYRSIYEIVVYQSELELSGSFRQLDFSEWNIKKEDVLWNEAFVSLGIPDMRGIQNDLELNWNQEIYEFEPGTEAGSMINSGVSAKVKIDGGVKKYPFDLKLSLNGSKNLEFSPVGKTTEVNIKSSWSNPSFGGSFLPDDRSIDDSGFNASWKVLHLNRNFPQKWREKEYDLSSANFGVKLLMPVDQYQKSTRSAKYATLFIGLTFMIFFFVEIKNKKRIHPFQYILVGLALCVFYTLLISLSEHINFNLAYVLASIGVIGIISAYSKSVFLDTKLTMITTGILVLLYGFLFIIIREQDYSLLIGSLALFFILGFLMHFSKNINWYENLRQPEEQAAT